MRSSRGADVLRQAARLYYLEGRTQSQVADELGVSRSNVSRILAQAREQQIVEIIIHDPDDTPTREPDLEHAIEERFGLASAVVLAARADDALDEVARAAALLLRERASEATTIGISWGRTLQSVATFLDSTPLRPAPRLLPLVGGLGVLDTLDSGDSVLRAVARKLGARPERLYAPALVESAAAQRAFLEQSVIREAIASAAEVQVAFVGIGCYGLYSSRHLVNGMRLSADELDQFLAADPVGDVCGRFVSRNGKPLGPPAADRVIGVTFDQLLHIPEVVGVAAGQEKADGVAAVLRSGVLKTLVIDATLARAILAM
ncbi:MAG: transcriptional regulator [Actinobacteria bacterium 69-20]|jgi:DNA-binding transcriptional regulator LsrR (DeoR family)|nr:transcriptional regulator [Actinomycetota bacterium]OJV23609.1 MAG: transcriptional regulator [Actinobacteria bacterium 69-20]